MPYATDRPYYDADSHIMELRDRLVGYADPDIREQLRPFDVGRGGGKAAEAAVATVGPAQSAAGDTDEEGIDRFFAGNFIAMMGAVPA